MQSVRKKVDSGDLSEDQEYVAIHLRMCIKQQNITLSSKQAKNVM